MHDFTHLRHHIFRLIPRLQAVLEMRLTNEQSAYRAKRKRRRRIITISFLVLFYVCFFFLCRSVRAIIAADIVVVWPSCGCCRLCQLVGTHDVHPPRVLIKSYIREQQHCLSHSHRIGHRENIARKKVKIEFETKKCNKMKQNSRGYIFSIQLVIMPAYGLTLFRPSTFGRSLLRLNLQNLRRAHCRHTQTTSRVCVRAVYIFAARSTIETATYATNTTQKSEHKISFSIHKTRNLKK